MFYFPNNIIFSIFLLIVCVMISCASNQDDDQEDRGPAADDEADDEFDDDIDPGPNAYDEIARTKGNDAKLAEEYYFDDHVGDVSGGYTDSLAELLVYDLNLTDDPGVTFNFYFANQSGFTFGTKHLIGTGIEWIFTD